LIVAVYVEITASVGVGSIVAVCVAAA